MMPFDAYRCYLSLKNHFTKDHYDYIKYRGKTRATHQAFYKRKDRFWFEKFARQKNDKDCLLYTSPSPRDVEESRMPSSA